MTKEELLEGFKEHSGDYDAFLCESVRFMNEPEEISETYESLKEIISEDDNLSFEDFDGTYYEIAGNYSSPFDVIAEILTTYQGEDVVTIYESLIGTPNESSELFDKLIDKSNGSSPNYFEIIAEIMGSNFCEDSQYEKIVENLQDDPDKYKVYNYVSDWISENFDENYEEFRIYEGVQPNIETIKDDINSNLNDVVEFIKSDSASNGLEFMVCLFSDNSEVISDIVKNNFEREIKDVSITTAASYNINTSEETKDLILSKLDNYSNNYDKQEIQVGIILSELSTGDSVSERVKEMVINNPELIDSATNETYEGDSLTITQISELRYSFKEFDPKIESNIVTAICKDENVPVEKIQQFSVRDGFLEGIVDNPKVTSEMLSEGINNNSISVIEPLLDKIMDHPSFKKEIVGELCERMPADYARIEEMYEDKYADRIEQQEDEYIDFLTENNDIDEEIAKDIEDFDYIEDMADNDDYDLSNYDSEDWED